MDKQCYWCGSFGNDANPVTISEDVPPRWLSGVKKIKEINCVPQCELCKKALKPLDTAVVDYFKYGAKIDLSKVERSNELTNNRGFKARKVILNGSEDFILPNGTLALWLRKLLVGIWYKDKGKYFEGSILTLAPWITWDDPDLSVSNIIIPSSESKALYSDIDAQIIGNDQQCYEQTIPFTSTFIHASRCGVPMPLELLRFSIYAKYFGYCLYIPSAVTANPPAMPSYLSIRRWSKCFPYIPPEKIGGLLAGTKSITNEEAVARVRL